MPPPSQQQQGAARREAEAALLDAVRRGTQAEPHTWLRFQRNINLTRASLSYEGEDNLNGFLEKTAQRTSRWGGVLVQLR